MTVASTAGSTFSISTAAPATYDVAGYAALTFTSVGEIVNFGEFGRQYVLITHNPVGTRSTQKFKGSYNEGTMNLQLGLDTDDAGQIICKAASKSDADHSIKVVTQNGDKYYFPVKVMGFKVGLGSVDQITAATIDMELTSSKTGVGIVEDLAP